MRRRQAGLEGQAGPQLAALRMRARREPRAYQAELEGVIAHNGHVLAFTTGPGRGLTTREVAVYTPGAAAFTRSRAGKGPGQAGTPGEGRDAS
jgi:hypothetical protein